jgi:hypothetical protein
LAAKQFGGHPTKPEILEAEPDQRGDGLGGIAVADVVGVQDPSQLGLDAVGSVWAQASSTWSMRSPITSDPRWTTSVVVSRSSSSNWVR